MCKMCSLMRTQMVLDQTPLSVACIVGDPDMVSLCCRWDANVNAIDADGATPLHHCIRRVPMAQTMPAINWCAVNSLIMHGASIYKLDGEQVSPRSLCAELDELQTRWATELARVALGVQSE